MKRTKRGRTVPAYEQIMTAARELFAKNGFRDTTIRMIAQKAKVNGAAINYYFSSKEALYEEIFDQAFQKFGRPLGDLIGTVKDQATWKAAQERSSPTEFCTRLYDDVFLPVVGVFRTLMRMALPDASPEAFQAVFVTYLGTCTCFMHRDPPWDGIEVCRTVTREKWVEMLREEIVSGITARCAFRTNRVPPGA